MTLMRTAERDVVAAVAALVDCNPFLPERVDLERRALGDTFVPATQATAPLFDGSDPLLVGLHDGRLTAEELLQGYCARVQRADGQLRRNRDPTGPELAHGARQGARVDETPKRLTEVQRDRGQTPATQR